VARKEGRMEAHRVFLEKPEVKRPLGRLGVNGSIILKWIFKKSFGRTWNLLTWLGSGIDPAGYTKYGQYLN
jgi:hypothetical protein